MYEYRIKKHIGYIPMDKLKKEDIENMALTNKNDKDNPIGLTYVDMIIDLCRTIINHAIKHNLYSGIDLTKNITRYKEENARLRYLSKDEINLLLNETKKLPNKSVYMCTLLALLTGARINVITHIKIKDIDFEQKSIKLFDEKGKKNKHYYGYINDNYIDTIKEYILTITDDFNSNLYLLNGKTEVRTKYYQDNIRPILHRLFNQNLTKDDRLNKVVVHTLRHTFGSQLVINGG